MLNNKISPWPSFTQEEVDAVQKVLLSNKVNYWTGDECKQFEKEFAEFSDSEYAIAVANGTLALELALKALDIGKNDEVIVTSRTFIASISAIISVGATPVFADVSLDSQNITPEFIREKITSKTKAIICVHLAGWPCEMDEIMQIANEFDFLVIEDCAQAHGAKYKGKSVGSIGNIGCWSFCQDKIMTTGGEGGMVTTNDQKLFKKMWSYKDHGKDYDLCHQPKKEGFNWLHTSLGSNYRMTEMQAAIGRIQLKKMPEWHQKRLRNANKIWDCALKINDLYVPKIPDYIEHAAYKCYIFTKKNINRDKILNKIDDFGIPCYFGSCSEVYLEQAFNTTNFKPKIRLKNPEKLSKTTLMFLVHPTLKDEEINRICEALNKFFK
jgi:dTDP-4-amino-4,6-dideoxygalactose transaminase